MPHLIEMSNANFLNCWESLKAVSPLRVERQSQGIKTIRMILQKQVKGVTVGSKIPFSSEAPKHKRVWRTFIDYRKAL